MLDFTWRQLDELEKFLGDTPRKIPVVVNRAVARTLTHMRTEAARKTRSMYILKHGDAIRTLTIRRDGKFSGAIEGKGFVIPIEKFKLSPRMQNPRRRKPLKATVKKGSGGLMPQAFTTSNGVYERVADKRFPIKRKFGPSIPSMMGNEEVAAHVMLEGEKELNKRLDHEINQMLR